MANDERGITASDLLGHRGGWGLLVEEELACAIRGKSATALEYWWGVSCRTVSLWRTG